VSLRKIVVLGPSQGRRLAALHDAAERQGGLAVEAVGYAEFVADPAQLAQSLGPGVWLRFDSPDEDPAAFRALYTAGAQQAEEQGYRVLSGADLTAACGGSAIGSPAQLALGMEGVLRKAAKIGAEAGAVLSADPGEVALCYDKRACAAHLTGHGLATPMPVEPPVDFDDLIETLRQTKGRRVFLKLRHGSGAAGTMALALGPNDQIAGYTALTEHGGQLHATKRVRRISNRSEVKAMVQALIPLGLHLEVWVPKAMVEGKTVDLRLVTTRTAQPFAVLRMADTPITNLHLDAARGADRPQAPCGVGGQCLWRSCPRCDDRR